MPRDVFLLSLPFYISMGCCFCFPCFKHETVREKRKKGKEKKDRRDGESKRMEEKGKWRNP